MIPIRSVSITDDLKNNDKQSLCRRNTFHEYTIKRDHGKLLQHICKTFMSW